MTREKVQVTQLLWRLISIVEISLTGWPSAFHVDRENLKSTLHNLLLLTFIGACFAQCSGPQSSRRSRRGTAEPWPSCGAQPFEWRRCSSCSAHRRCSLPSSQGAEGPGLAESTAFAEQQQSVTLMESTILWLNFKIPWRKKSHGVKSSEFWAHGVPRTVLLKLI